MVDLIKSRENMKKFYENRAANVQVSIDPGIEAGRAKTRLFLALWRFNRELAAINFRYLSLTPEEHADFAAQWNALVQSIKQAMAAK